jgi:hypothetical protein
MFWGFVCNAKGTASFPAEKNFGRPRGRPILQFWLSVLLRLRRVCHQARMT